MFTIEVEREADGRWIAEIPDLPGALAYGQTREEAIERVQALSLRVMEDRAKRGIRKKFKRALNKVTDVEPEEIDRI